mmetsp:Transcript_14247/g.39038  ORF Transcript_14247/g.39038 Transcript_14247/m.39038 type:complete len:255 (+) Transcript_14247:646-1410(+)
MLALRDPAAPSRENRQARTERESPEGQHRGRQARRAAAGLQRCHQLFPDRVEQPRRYQRGDRPRLAVGAPVLRLPPGLQEAEATQEVQGPDGLVQDGHHEQGGAKHREVGGQQHAPYPPHVVLRYGPPPLQVPAAVGPLGHEAAHEDEEVHGDVRAVHKCASAGQEVVGQYPDGQAEPRPIEVDQETLAALALLLRHLPAVCAARRRLPDSGNQRPAARRLLLQQRGARAAAAARLRSLLKACLGRRRAGSRLL